MDVEKTFLKRVTVKASIRKKGLILLTCDKNYPDQWELPGGRIDENEQPIETLGRELQEELALKIIEAKLVAAIIWHSDRLPVSQQGNSRLSLIYQVDIGRQTPSPGAEIKEARWFDADELKMVNIQANSRDFVLANVRGRDSSSV